MKTIYIPIFIAAIILPVFVSAENFSLETILAEIMSSQNVTEVTSINCRNVSNEQFEKLGDAAMGVIHPDEQQHELMDQMMGGEGSTALEAMHIVMGQNYLGCGTGVMGGGVIGGTNMMSMMGNWSGYSNQNLFTNNMMSGWWGWSGWFFMVFFWILLVLGTAALIKWIIKK